jgi:hypothetical protein
MWDPGVNLQTITSALRGMRSLASPKSSIYGLLKSTVYALDRKHGGNHRSSRESSRGAENRDM